MISTLILDTIVFLASLLFSVLPDVTALPTIGGVDTDVVVGNLFGTLNGIGELLPPIGTVITAVMWYYGILLAFMMYHMFRWLIGLIRGSGS